MPLVLCGPFALSISTLGLMTNVGIYMLLALGLNITVGMTGMLVLGYAGFFAFGAYLFAIGQQYNPLLSVVAGGAACVSAGRGGRLFAWFALPCACAANYLAIVTLGFAEAFRETIRNLDFTGGDQGIIIKSYATFRPMLGLTGK